MLTSSPSKKWPGRLLLLFLILAPVPAVVAREATTRPSDVSVEFLNKEQARSAIIDESMEPYFKLLQPMEMSVKTGEPIGEGTLEQQRERCRKRYQDAVEEFTDDEKAALRWYVSKLQPMVEKDYPLYAKTPWSFIKLSEKFEGGMPHTRGGHIVLSPAAAGTLAETKKFAEEWAALAQGGDVLLHEQMHVVQREHPGSFIPLYTKFWKFKHADAVKGCDWLTQHQLVNPDGVDVRWVYPIQEGGTTHWIWPLVIFGADADPQNASFADMQMVAIDVEPDGDSQFKAKLEADGKPVMRPLMAAQQYVSDFDLSRNIYHPNEAAADLFAKIVVLNQVLLKDHAGPNPGRFREASTRLDPLRKQFEAALK